MGQQTCTCYIYVCTYKTVVHGPTNMYLLYVHTYKAVIHGPTNLYLLYLCVHLQNCGPWANKYVLVVCAHLQNCDPWANKHVLVICALTKLNVLGVFTCVAIPPDSYVENSSLEVSQILNE